MSGYFSLAENSGRVSGMGSTEDPFLVSDLDTFRWAIHQSCEYVKLCADLDCSELEYWTGVTVNASVGCKPFILVVVKKCLFFVAGLIYLTGKLYIESTSIIDEAESSQLKTLTQYR